MVLAQIGRPVRVGSIHLGGGTPNMLSPGRILSGCSPGLAARFDLGDCFEIAAELDPETLTADWVEAAGRIGLSRASLGVQDLSPRVQAAVNRPESFETIRWAVEALREQGVASINLDLMYGLPLQAVENVITTLGQITTLKPDRIALFGYAHVPWMKPHQKLINEDDLPDAEMRFVQSQSAARYLASKGWQAIGLDHFALPHDSLAAAARAGRLHRNFQGYTTDEAQVLIGLGVSAIGRLPRGYVQNAPDIAGYARAIESGEFATVKGIALSADDRLRARVIERLMCDLSVDLDAAADEVGSEAPGRFADELGSLIPFVRDGLLDIDGRRIKVTEQGRPFLRVLASTFDVYLQAKPARHSMAV